MIGLSLSLCIKDIVENKYGLDDVDAIVASTCAKSQKDWLQLFYDYKTTYWKTNPDYALGVLLRLVGDNKIVQPRLTNPNYFRNCGSGWWI